MLDRSQPANLFDAARPEADDAGASTQPLPRIEQTRPPRSPRVRRPRPARAPRTPLASVASRFPGAARPRLGAIASAARRHAKFLPAAVVVLLLLTHPVGCDRSTPTAPARRAAVPAAVPGPAAPVAVVTRRHAQTLTRRRSGTGGAPRTATHRRARALPDASPAPTPTRRPAPSSRPTPPTASVTRVGTPVAAPTYVPPAPPRSYARPAPSPNRSEPNGEFGFETQAAHQ